MVASCGECVFFRRYASTLSSGECRRHAPRPSCDVDAVTHPSWPEVEIEEWCGEGKLPTEVQPGGSTE